MEYIDPSFHLDLFFEQVAHSPTPLLLLDYDGTLAPFHPDRSRAYPYPHVRELLDALIAQGRTRLVIVSGRAIGDLGPLLQLDRMPEVWGSHGWEHMSAEGRYTIGMRSSIARDGLMQARRWTYIRKLSSYCEEKPAGLAFHWRGFRPADIALLSEEVWSAWGQIAESAGLELHRFDGGIELRIPGRNKGTAVAELLAQTPAHTAAAYLGDDQTDEDAFLAMQGRGASILVRQELRPTAAHIRLAPPEELIGFLTRWYEARALARGATYTDDQKGEHAYE